MAAWGSDEYNDYDSSCNHIIEELARPHRKKDGYDDPSQIPTQYRYRAVIDNYVRGLVGFEIKKWCEENCLRKYEAIVIQTGEKKYALVAAFEKKIDCVAFKLRWV